MASQAAPRPPHRALRDGIAFDLGRLLLGLVALGLGTLYLLDAAGTLDAGKATDHWWPVLIVAVGAFQLAETRRSNSGPLVLIGIGAVLLLFTTHALEGDAGDYVGPLILIALGLVILTRWRGGRLPREGDADELIRADGILGGPKVSCTSHNFRGASLTAVLGGVTLDLRQARPAPDGAVINATSALGGIDVLVPRGWRVTLTGTPILGGVKDLTDHDDEPAAGAPVLHVDGLAVLGSVEVKHKE